MIRSKRKTAYALIFAALLASAAFFCVFSAPLQKSALNALFVCASSLVPSLFPFMVISSLLTQSAPYLFGSSSRQSRLFDLPAASAVAVLLGSLCGFPMGVVTVAGLKRRGLIDRRQAQRLAAVSNNTGPAFVAEVIGASFWGSRTIGIKLYLIQLASAALLGAVFLAATAKRPEENRAAPRVVPASGGARFTVVFTEAVGQAALGIVRVCAFVVFFSVVLDGAAILFPRLPAAAFAAISCVFEFTSGCRLAASVGGRIGAAMCAFAIGFSGISVMAQSAAFAAAEDIGMKKLFVFKLFQGILSAIAAYFII